MIKIQIDVTKIDKERLYPGKFRADGTTPKYLWVNLVAYRDGVDDYGNHGFASEDVSKEERLAGIKGTILGNWKRLDFGDRRAKDGEPVPVAPVAAKSQWPSGSEPKVYVPKDSTHIKNEVLIIEQADDIPW